MTRDKNQNTSTNRESKAPAFIAWHVSERDEKSFWSRIGAAWDHKDGEGMTLQLETVPMNGRIVLRKPQADEDAGQS
ncbi:hypothetical protein [Methyloligella solikamskensis]|uniref:Uncharacterized protein n=1 Tax=Methyloligella solikamskensis TaxID=1177756 RepID=A0ABW3J7K3_9HYPH